jgi:hypothetical protein
MDFYKVLCVHLKGLYCLRAIVIQTYERRILEPMIFVCDLPSDEVMGADFSV